MNGTQRMPSTTITTVASWPTRTSCRSVACGPELAIDVEGDQRRARVEGRRERRHQRRHQRRHHEAGQPGGQQAQHHHRVGVVAGDVGIQRLGDHPGQHQDEHRRDLQQRRQHGAAARVRLVLRAEHALHHRLVGAPVPDAEDRRAEEDAGPREVRVAHRPDHREEVGRHLRAQRAPAADLVEAEHREDDRAGEQDDRLHQFGVDDRRQAASHRVHAGGTTITTADV